MGSSCGMSKKQIMRHSRGVRVTSAKQDFKFNSHTHRAYLTGQDLIVIAENSAIKRYMMVKKYLNKGNLWWFQGDVIIV